MGCLQSSPVRLNPSAAATKRPLMSPEEQAKTKKILDDHFKINMRFLPHIASLKAIMHKKLLKARDRISSRDGLTDDESSRPQRQPPRISFLRYSDEKKHQASREEGIQFGMRLIQERMDHLQLRQFVMKDDGNCQFRAIAHQLFGDADSFHQHARAQAVQYLSEHKSDYCFYFDGDEEWKRYLKTMAMDGTWGDEITLKAICNTFGCTVHVLTSEKEHYYICYQPDDETNNNNEDQALHDIFLAYISPVHYNSIALVVEEENKMHGNGKRTTL